MRSDFCLLTINQLLIPSLLIIYAAALYSILLVRVLVCVCVCVFIQLHITVQSGPVIYLFYATACNPPGAYLCVCVFIKLHITTQSGPVILVILCHSH